VTQVSPLWRMLWCVVKAICHPRPYREGGGFAKKEREDSVTLYLFTCYFLLCPVILGFYLKADPPSAGGGEDV